MSGTLQTVTATVTVVQLSIAAAELIRKIACAQDEARKWLSELNHLMELWTLVNDIVSERMPADGGELSASPHEERIIKIIRSYMVACEEHVASVLRKLAPLDQHPDYFQISSVPARLKFLYDKKFIEDQEKRLDRLIARLNSCLGLLPMVYVNASTASRTGRGIEPACLQRVLSIDTSSSIDFGTLSNSITQNSQSVDDWSGHTLISSSSSRHRRVMTLDSDEGVAASPNTETRSIDTNKPNPEDSSLIKAVEEGNLEEVRTLLDISADQSVSSLMMENVRRPDSEGWTVLHHAAYQCDQAMTHILLEFCHRNAISIVNVTNSEDHTALMEVAKKADRPAAIDIARELLAHGAEIDKADEEGRCALHFAMRKPPTSTTRERFVDVLLKNTPTPDLGLVLKNLDEKYIEKKYPKVWKMYKASHRQRTNSFDSGIGMGITQASR